MVLSMYGAREVDEATAPESGASGATAGAKRTGLPMPKVYIAENDQPNAFATGRNPEHAAVCVTTGLLNRVSQEELAGVLAHELGHVKNRDTLTMTIVATIGGAIGMLANFAFFMGGGRRNNPLGLVGVDSGGDSGADRRDAGADGGQPLARVRGGPRRRQSSGRPLWLASALQRIETAAGAIENPDGRRQSRDGASCSSSIRCMAAACRLVRKPSVDGGTHRAAEGDGRRYGASCPSPVPGAEVPPAHGRGRHSRAGGGAERPSRRSPQTPSTRRRARRRHWPRASLEPRDAGFARAIATETLRRSANCRR